MNRSFANSEGYTNADNTRIGGLFSPEPVEQKDIWTRAGRIRVFWIKRHLVSLIDPLVLLHGWVAGSGCFFRNVQSLASNRAVLLIDLPGFGESERHTFGENPEEDFTAAIQDILKSEIPAECWLVGHSFGGYVATLVSLTTETRLKGLILLDAWGFVKTTQEEIDERMARLSTFQLFFLNFLKKSNLQGLDLMRKFPKCLGLTMMKKLRKDLKEHYGDEFFEYMYEINSQTPATGETAFAKLCIEWTPFARHPMEARFLELKSRLPAQVHFVSGGKSWIKPDPFRRIVDVLQCSTNIKCSFTMIESATHHLMCTHPDDLHQVVKSILS